MGSKTIARIVDLLNEREDGEFIQAAPYTGFGTVKCIYDCSKIDLHELFEIANLLAGNCE